MIHPDCKGIVCNSMSMSTQWMLQHEKGYDKFLVISRGTTSKRSGAIASSKPACPLLEPLDDA